LACITLENAAGITGADLSLRLPAFAAPGPAQTSGLALGFLVASRPRAAGVAMAIASANGLPSDHTVTIHIPLTISQAAEPGMHQLTLERVQLYDSTPSPVASHIVTGTLLVTPAPLDLDADGLPDDWELTFFGNTDLTGEADTDNDGVADSGEFLAGTDPTRAESVFAIDHMTATLGQGTVELQWLGGGNHAYEIEWSDDPLGPGMNWHSVYNPTIDIDEAGARWIDDGSRTYQLPQATDRRFYRVRIRLP
jgi:hypothetical protein